MNSTPILLLAVVGAFALGYALGRQQAETPVAAVERHLRARHLVRAALAEVRRDA